MKRHQISIGIIKNTSGQVLLAERPSGKHLAGCWEFPGGKVESKETYKLALRRELQEEINIEIEAVKKILEYRFQYSDRHLQFQVFEVLSYSNKIKSVESQNLQWVTERDIDSLNIPPANIAILHALRLPDLYMIACHSVYKDNLFDVVETQLRAGVTIIQFRAPSLNKSQYIARAIELRDLCEQHGAKLICNCDLSWVDEINPHGIHLTSARLKEAVHNGECNNYFSVSCHDESEINLANALNIHCILVGAVNFTLTHPNNHSLGWEKFRQLCHVANYPVYALGGLGKDDLITAKVCGAQGIAGIRLFGN